MKILLYGINFAPEPTGIGKYTGEMATWLAEHKHEVRVITAPPYYPAWRVAEGYSAWRGSRETAHGVKIWRAPLWVPRQPSGLKRIVHLLSFAIGSLPALAAQLAWKPDAIVVIAPALSCAPAAWLTARLSGAKAWLHIQDFEVDAAFQMGLLKGKVSQRIVSACERWLLRRFDRVSTISGRMLELLHAKRVDPERTVLFRNWVNVDAIVPLQEPSGYRAELGIPDDAVVALYSGSMVGKQGLDILPPAARELLARHPKLYFVLCGEGVFKPSLERDCAGLDRVRILPLQPACRLGELLGMADIHLLPQHVQAADLVMPSKLTGMLSSGRPVLTTANPDTELASVVERCGIVVPPNDLAAFCDALMLLANNASLRAELGAAARQYAETYLAGDRVLADFVLKLKLCTGQASITRADGSSSADDTPKLPEVVKTRLMP